MVEDLITKVQWSELRDTFQQEWGFGRVNATQLTTGARSAPRLIASERRSHLAIHDAILPVGDDVAADKTGSDDVPRCARVKVCGTRDGLQPCAYELSEQLLFQLHGRRRVLVVDPAYTFRGVYPYPADHPLDRQSMVDWDKVDLVRFPKCTDVRGRVVVLGPGEMLYLPQFFWAHVQNLEETCIALHVVLGSGSRTRRHRSPSSAELATSRLLEQRVVEKEGQKDAKRFLEAVAVGEESELIDTSSLKVAAAVRSRAVVSHVAVTLSFRHGTARDLREWS
eukprot:scaffold1411_cov396-Prasinococcus_capsulatus_cf.AAC.12